MARWVALAGLFVVFVLVGTGPLSGIEVTRASADSFGDGTATVSAVAVDQSELALTAGRFGANVTYLRIPATTVTVDSVTGRPRLVYIVSVPGLDRELVETRVLTEAGRYQIAPDDTALPAGSAAGTYDATLTVRLQSFTTDRTLAATTVAVGDA